MTPNLAADRAYIQSSARSMKSAIDALYGAVVILQAASGRELGPDMLATTERALDVLGIRLRDMARVHESMGGVFKDMKRFAEEEVAKVRGGLP